MASTTRPPPSRTPPRRKAAKVTTRAPTTSAPPLATPTPPPPETPPTTRPTVTVEVVGPWRRNCEIQRLTKEILALEHDASGHFVDACLAIAERLEAAHERLPHGDWLDWIDEALPYTLRTVRNYLALLEWCRRQKEEFDRFRHLEASKLYRIVRLPPPDRERLVVTKKYPIPGTDKKATLDRMTVRELNAVIDGFATKPDGPPPLPALLPGNAPRDAALEALIDTFATHPDRLSRTQARQLRTQLLQAAKRLEQRLDL